jgi:transcriptional regulator with AAA-type ATPase domain
VRQSPGYYSDVAPEEVDYAAFAAGSANAAAAVESADWADALAEADAALALWRGPFLADLRDEEWAEREAARAGEMFASSPRSALVGRERELVTVTELLADVSSGATAWLVLSGPPGIGKTRLAEEAAARAGA